MRSTRLPISKTSHYDVIVIGAGINGCASAYFLNKAGLRVALIDQEGIASGGSGAAGAFISPKISKSGPLKEVIEKAHAYAMDFYGRFFPECMLCRPLLHIAKTPEDAEKVRAFKAATSLALLPVDTAIADLLCTDADDDNSVFLSEGAIVNARLVCQSMAEGIDFYQEKVIHLTREEGMWSTGSICGGHVVLATGAYPKIFDLPYLKLRAIWGHRIDIRTTSEVPCILHHHVSISPTSEDGVMAIGATHDVHYSPFSDGPYEHSKGRDELLQKASYTLKLDNVNVLRDYTGLRSGSNDYYPILGPIIDTDKTLEMRSKVDINGYVHYPDLTMINGSGGYGFVLAPYLAKKLSEHLVYGHEIDKDLQPVRFFDRWIKKNQS